MSLNAGVNVTSHQSNRSVVLHGTTMSHDALREVHDLLVIEFHANLRSVSEKQIGGAKELVLVGTCKEGVVGARLLARPRRFLWRLHARGAGELRVAATDGTPIA